jgi:N-acetylmuramoyl-L-alanine amidase
VVIDLGREIEFSKGILKDKHNSKKTKSIYLNLKNSVILETRREMIINDGILQRVKIAQFNARTVRAVIHVGNIDHYKIFALSNPPRIVIDVIGGNYKKSSRRTAKASVNRSGSKTDGTLSLARQLGLGVGTIVIDAGHGGKDPGALSPGGAREKDVVLDIAKRLRKILQEKLNFSVITTRDTDRFIPLEERTVIANTKKADMFISIHANASRSRRAHGVETYFLNLSTDKEAMELAALENSTSTKNIGQLQSILNDLMQNSKIKESSRLAGCVQAALVGKLRKSYSNINNYGVKQAPFYVLIGAQMPSILVEVSFISNKMESKRLASPAYRQKIAEGLADGVQKYISEIKLARR